MDNKLIIFDFDGTLADSMWAWDELGRVTLETDGLKPLPNYEAVIRTMSVPHFAIHLSNIYPSLGDGDSLLLRWHEMMVYNYCNRIPLKKGAIELLEYLKSKGYTLYLASATHMRVLSKAIEHFGLNKYFDFILTEEVVGISKRDPKIYKLCMEKANTTAENTYLFEDANHAVKTANNLGIHVCGISDYSMREHEEEVKENSEIYLDDFSNLEAIKKFLNITE